MTTLDQCRALLESLLVSGVIHDIRNNDIRLADIPDIDLEEMAALLATMTTRRLKPLEWVDSEWSEYAVGGCSYANTAFGRFKVNWSNLHVSTPWLQRGESVTAVDVEQGKTMCWDAYRARVDALFAETEPGKDGHSNG